MKRNILTRSPHSRWLHLLAFGLVAVLLFIPLAPSLAAPPAQEGEPTTEAATDTPLPAADTPTPEAATPTPTVDTPTPEPPTATLAADTPAPSASDTPAPPQPTPTPAASETPQATPTLSATPSPTAAVSDEEAIRLALDSAIHGKQQEVLALMVNTVSIDHMTFAGDRSQALVWLALVDAQSGETLATEPGLAIANRNAQQPATWDVTLQSDAGWVEALQQVPDDLLPAEDKQLLMPPGEEVMAQASLVLRGYRLPWAAGLAKRVSGSIGHVLTYQSCPSTCRYAYDFADGTMFPLLAARGGRVKYAVWKYANGNEENANYLVLEDTTTSPTTYQVYYHLAQNSIPERLRVAGAVVRQGEFIGNVDDTGYSTGHHLHFHVHTNAATYWGSSVDIRFDDVSINDGTPRTCAETAAYPQYGTQCSPGNLLVSGNTGQQAIVPPPVTLIAPNGKVTATQPTYQWYALSGATQYELQVTPPGSSSYSVRQTLAAATVCSGSTCSYKPAVSLKDGSYEFRVRAANSYGWGEASPALAFSVVLLPPAPTLQAPTGTITTHSPTYRWQAVNGATQYYLMVYSDTQAKYVIYRTLSASAVCAGSACSYVSTVSLTHGSYRFKVQAYNPAGWGAFSAWTAFKAELLPPAPALTAPQGEINTNLPAYRWKPVSGASKYTLSVLPAASTSATLRLELSASKVCTASECSYTPTTKLKEGTYRFQVKAANRYGYGAYTEMSFKVVLLPPVPTLIAPGGTITTTDPAYTWSAVPLATQYYLMVYSLSEGKYVIYRTLNAGNVCSGNTCSYVSTISVVRGRAYRFKVRAGNAYGWSAYTPMMDFRVQ